MMALLAVAARRPQHNWYTADPLAHDPRFWEQILTVLQAGPRLLLEVGFTNYDDDAQLIAPQVTFITRCKSNPAYHIQQVLHKSAHRPDDIIG